MGKRVTDPRLIAALRARQETTLPANITDESVADLDLNGPPVMHGPGFASPEQDAEMAGYAYDKQRKERAYVGPPMGMGEAAIQKGIEGATLGFNDVAGGVMGAAKQAIAPDYMTENSPLGDRLKFGYRQGHDSVTMANVRAGDALGPLSLPVEMAGGIATGGPVMKGAKALLAPVAKRAPAVLAPLLGGDAAAAGLAGGVGGYGASEDWRGGVIGSIFAGGGTAAMGSEAAKNLAGKARNEASEKWAKVIGSTGGQKADIDRVGGIDTFRELGRWGRDRGVVGPFTSPEGAQATLLGMADGQADRFNTLLPELQRKVAAAGQTRNPGVQFNINNVANATAQNMGVTKKRFGNNLVANINDTADGVAAMAKGERDLWMSGQGSPFAPVPHAAPARPAPGAPPQAAPASPVQPPMPPGPPTLTGATGPRQTSVAWQSNPNAVVTPPPASPAALPPGPPGPGESPMAVWQAVEQGPQVIHPRPIPGSGASPTSMVPFGGVEPVPPFRPQVTGPAPSPGLPVGSTPQPALPAPAASPLMDLPGAHNYSKGVGQSITWGKKDAKKIAENTMLQDHWGNIREELSGAVRGASAAVDPSAAPAWEALLNDSKLTTRGLRLADDGVARRAGFRFLGLGPTMAAAGGNPWLAAGLKAVQSFGNGVAGWGLDKTANSLARGASPNKWIAGGYQAGDLLDSIIDEDNRKKLGQ